MDIAVSKNFSLELDRQRFVAIVILPNLAHFHMPQYLEFAGEAENRTFRPVFPETLESTPVTLVGRRG